MRSIIKKRYIRQLLSEFFTIFTAMGMIDKNKHGAENFILRRYEYCLKMLNLLEGKERLFDTPQDEIYRL